MALSSENQSKRNGWDPAMDAAMVTFVCEVMKMSPELLSHECKCRVADTILKYYPSAD